MAAYLVENYTKNVDTHRLTIWIPILLIAAFCYGLVLIQPMLKAQPANSQQTSKTNKEPKLPNLSTNTQGLQKLTMVPAAASQMSTSAPSTTTAPQQSSGTGTTSNLQPASPNNSAAVRQNPGHAKERVNSTKEKIKEKANGLLR